RATDLDAAYAANLVSTPTTFGIGLSNVFVEDVRTHVVTLVSTNSSGIIGNADSTNPVFSPDGNSVAFQSGANNLLPNDSLPLSTGAITLVSSNSSGIQANSESTHPSFSPDGGSVVFQSFANNLVPNVNGLHVYVKSLTSGGITLASSDSSGTAGNSSSFQPSF